MTKQPFDTEEEGHGLPVEAVTSSVVPVVLKDEELYAVLNRTRRWVLINLILTTLLILGAVFYASINIGNQQQLFRHALNAEAVIDNKVEAIAEQTAEQTAKKTVDAVAAKAEQAVSEQKKTRRQCQQRSH